MDTARQGALNRDAFSLAGLADENLSTSLDISQSYVDQLLSGSKPISGPIRAKLDALIAAKANGPEKVEQFEADLQPSPVLTPTNELSSWCEPADLPPASDYAVIDATDGTAVLVEILARFNNHTAARKICQKLNKEGG